MTSLNRLSVQELAASYADGSLSPVEATNAALDAIWHLDSQVNAFVLVNPETALAQAHQSEARWRASRALGPADGVPTSIKDIFLTRD
jgi:aspartyl-tRNA(Asn)/glutamyl-tRNA(Gln) amidotransferase subunit A